MLGIDAGTLAEALILGAAVACGWVLRMALAPPSASRCRHERGKIIPGTSEDLVVCSACQTTIAVPHHDD